MTRDHRSDKLDHLSVLKTQLGTTLVDALMGASMNYRPNERSVANKSLTTRERAERLYVAHQVWDVVANAESADLARAWFIGANPRLNGDTPLTAIREGRYEEALGAARAQSEDTGSF